MNTPDIEAPPGGLELANSRTQGPTAPHPNSADPRINALLARKPLRLVTVALANRAARAIWAIMVRGDTYRAPTLASATA